MKGICFTPGLAAPEVFQFACEDSMCTPEDERVGRGNSFASDAYTFAVYLFKQLAGCHPFTGEAFLQAVQNADSPEEEFYLLQSGQFAYIADENDDSNRGHPFPLENVCSSELIALFQQTFCQEGRDNCLSRPGMNEWAVALARANDWALHCSGCGMDYVNESHHRCPWCDEPKPAVLTAESVCLARSSDAPPLWRFRRELSDECGIALPLRLAHGYDANELDKKLLTVSRENGELLVRIDVADPNLKVLFSEDKQSFAEYRTIKTVAKHFYLRCKNAARQTDVLVECGVSS